MTTHELAQALLAGPDIPAVINFDGRYHACPVEISTLLVTKETCAPRWDLFAGSKKKKTDHDTSAL